MGDNPGITMGGETNMGDNPEDSNGGDKHGK